MRDIKYMDYKDFLAIILLIIVVVVIRKMNPNNIAITWVDYIKILLKRK